MTEKKPLRAALWNVSAHQNMSLAIIQMDGWMDGLDWFWIEKWNGLWIL